MIDGKLLCYFNPGRVTSSVTDTIILHVPLYGVVVILSCSQAKTFNSGCEKSVLDVCGSSAKLITSYSNENES